MHLGSFESTQEARVARGYASSSRAHRPNLTRASITRYAHAKYEPILNFFIVFMINENFVVRNIPSDRNKIISLHCLPRSKLHFSFHPA